MKQKYKQLGFTLIELLVVITIVGILSGIGVGTFQSAQARARDAKRKADLKSIGQALQLYYNDHGSFPPGGWYADCWSANWIPGLDANYIKQMPHDPKPYCAWPWDPSGNGQTYAYWSGDWQGCTTAGQSYLLVANMENKSDPGAYNLVTVGTCQNAWGGPVFGGTAPHGLYTVANP